MEIIMLAAIVLALMTTVCSTHAYATHDKNWKRPERPDGGSAVEKKKKPKKYVTCNGHCIKCKSGFLKYGKK